jgi:HNH endonuclease
MVEIINKSAAKAAGLKRFCTGRPCKYGHISERFVASGMCVQCQRDKYAANPQIDKARIKAWRDANPEKAAAQAKKWSAGVSPERMCEHKRKHYVKHRDKILAGHKHRYAEDPMGNKARAAKWYAENREHAIARIKQWSKDNPDKFRAIQRTRKARKKGAEGSHSADDIAAIRLRQKDRCAYCRKPLKGKGEVDHIEPLARGGSNWPSNLQLLCIPCNRHKSAIDPIEFMQSQGFLL